MRRMDCVLVAYLEVKIPGVLCYLAPEYLAVAETLYDVRSRHGFGEQR